MLTPAGKSGLGAKGASRNPGTDFAHARNGWLRHLCAVNKILQRLFPHAAVVFVACGIALMICETRHSCAQDTRAAAGTTSTAQIRIEYFGTEHGYTVGQNDLVLICVARNVGPAQAPGKTLRLRCYPVAGLDYTNGDMTPELPPLAANQAVTFRWRLTPTDSRQPLVAAVQVENMRASMPAIVSQSSQSPVVFAVVPRFDSAPHFGAPIPGANVSPRAGTAGGEAWLAGSRAALRILTSDRDEPLMLLAGKVGPTWHMVASGLPLARVRSAEDGQLPWWETLRWRGSRAHSEKDMATLTLYGSIGRRWGAELTLEARRDTSAFDGRLTLTAHRMIRCFAVQLPRLLVTETDGAVSPAVQANGSPGPIRDREPSHLTAVQRVVAAHRSGITFGLTWPRNPPIQSWRWSRIDGPPGGDSTLGAECGVADGSEVGDIIQPEGSLVIPFRIFAFGPSDTVRDALRFVH